MAYVGIDLHKRELTVCYRCSEDDQRFEVFPNTPEGRLAFLDTLSCRDRVAVESLGFGRHLTHLMLPKVKEVTHVHSASYGLVFDSIKKTDKHDAAVLAFGLEKGILPRSRFRSEISHQIGRLLSVRDTLIGMRISITNYMNAIVASNGIDVPVGKMRYRVWRDGIPIEQFEFGDYTAWLALNTQLEQIATSVKALEKDIIANSKLMEGYITLTSIPGFGFVTVAELLAYIDGIENFASSKALCSYFGIVPRTRKSSGENVVSTKLSRYRAGAITRKGRKSARSAIVMSVNRVLKENASLRDFYDKIKGRKGYRKARTAAARKLLTFIYFALKKGEVVEDFSAVDFAQPHKV